jgi:cyanamide hydratase
MLSSGTKFVNSQIDAMTHTHLSHNKDIFVHGGNITMIGQILQLATILDNVGL